MRRRQPSFHQPSDAAFSEVNTTPLIDVMLVLLILFIICVPMMSHKIPLRLPQPGPPLPEQPVSHRLYLDAAGQMTWNGTGVTLAELPRYLELVERDQRSRLEIAASGAARYEDYDRMLGVVKRAGIDRIDVPGLSAFQGELDRAAR